MTTANDLTGLAGRLTGKEDRERYAGLMCYLNSLSPGDEMLRLAEMMGLTVVMGQRVPEAIGEFLAEMRELTRVSAEYHGRVDTRLAHLPQEIAAGVDPAAIAKAMGESFRQQLATSGLQDTAALLKAAVITLKALSGEVTGTLKPAASTLSEETEKLLAAVRQMEEQNARLVHRERKIRWCLAGMGLFFLGGLFGGTMVAWW